MNQKTIYIAVAVFAIVCLAFVCLKTDIPLSLGKTNLSNAVFQQMDDTHDDSSLPRADESGEETVSAEDYLDLDE